MNFKLLDLKNNEDNSINLSFEVLNGKLWRLKKTIENMWQIQKSEFIS